MDILAWVAPPMARIRATQLSVLAILIILP
jgi:hypothetical protein